MAKVNDDNIKVCVRSRPLFYDEKQAKISMDYTVNWIKLIKVQENEETKTYMPAIMQQSSMSKSRQGWRFKKIYNGKIRYTNNLYKKYVFLIE